MKELNSHILSKVKVQFLIEKLHYVIQRSSNSVRLFFKKKYSWKSTSGTTIGTSNFFLVKPAILEVV